jgi:cytochrome c oxidase subunit 2
LAGCSQSAVRSNSLEPQGPAANQIADLWWLMLALGTMTFLVVMGLLAWGLWRRRRGEESNYQIAKGRSQKLIVGGGVIFPAVILTIVFGFTLKTLSGLNSMQQDGALVIEVIGHQWWWEINYPEQGFTTANEIHIPAGEPVEFRLEAADVIHSFWVPSLHGKRDLIPGQTNTLWLEADEPGEYQGLCAEFCGIQHAKMLFVIVAEPQADFDDWLAAQQETAVIPTDELAEEGFLVFMDQGCNDCHTVRGTAADGELGPDLTHFASRLTLASGAYPNNREYLTEWIVNPHDLKEGNFMPATSLSDQELEALLTYLGLLQ